MHHMTKFPFDIIGFDLDGTLVDTSGDLTAAVNHVLASVGRPLLSIEAVKQHIGGGAKLMLQQGLEATGGIPGNDFKPLYKQMLAYYQANVSEHSARSMARWHCLTNLTRWACDTRS